MSVQCNFQDRRTTNPAARDSRRQLCHHPETMAEMQYENYVSLTRNSSSTTSTSLQYHHVAASVPASASSSSDPHYYSPFSFWEDNAKIIEQDSITPRRPSSPSLAPQVLLSSFVLEEWDEPLAAGADDENDSDERSEVSSLFISCDLRSPFIGNMVAIDDRPPSPTLPFLASFIEQQHTRDADSDLRPTTISNDSWLVEDHEDSVFYSNIFTDNVQHSKEAAQQEIQFADAAAEDSSSFDAFPFFSGLIFEDQTGNKHHQYSEPPSSIEFVSSDERQEKNSIPVNDNQQQGNNTVRTTNSSAEESSQPQPLVFNTIAPASNIPPNRVDNLSMYSNENNPAAAADSSRIQMRYFLQPTDRPLTSTGFTMEVMNQLEITYFGEKDRRSRRKDLPPHFPGVACRHCKPIAGKGGRYFPSTLKTFSDQKKMLFAIHSHLQKCSHCPNALKAKLVHLKTSHRDEKEKLQHLPVDQRQFYRRVWAKIRAMDNKL